MSNFRILADEDAAISRLVDAWIEAFLALGGNSLRGVCARYSRDAFVHFGLADPRLVEVHGMFATRLCEVSFPILHVSPETAYRAVRGLMSAAFPVAFEAAVKPVDGGLA